MEAWNFHGYIAVPLEHYGRTYLGVDFVSADEIEYGEFVEAMLKILSVEYGDLGLVSEFVALINPYAGTPAKDIPKETAIELYEDFKRILKTKNM